MRPRYKLKNRRLWDLYTVEFTVPENCKLYLTLIWWPVKCTASQNGAIPHLIEVREIARLTLFHKAIIHGESALEFPSYIKRRNRQLRSSHNDKLVELRPKTEAYRNSFCCRTIKEWNSLPSNVLSPVQTDATLLDVTCCVRLHTCACC